jgi:glycosyltransferase involved in cell wall biosynthesis
LLRNFSRNDETQWSLKIKIQSLIKRQTCKILFWNHSMKLLVFAHHLEIGGTQFNAIELASCLRDNYSVDVVFVAAPGPMAKLVNQKKLRYYPVPAARFHPSFDRMGALRRVVRLERPDLIHAWDWWQGLEAYFAIHLPMGIPLVISDMMMTLTRVLPRQIPTTFGTPALVEEAGLSGWKSPSLMLPPVDLSHNSSASCTGRDFRKLVNARENEIVLVSVSRLADYMKSEPIERAIHAIRELGPELPVKLVIVGDGGARQRLEAIAQNTNSYLCKKAVVFVGAMPDPRPAYAAADIVVGMGGSALRAMAFGKPVIIVGGRGFADVFSPDSFQEFYHKGMYGHGNGVDTQIRSCIMKLTNCEHLRGELGSFGHEFVREYHSLNNIALDFLRLCRETLEKSTPARTPIADPLRTFSVYLRERRFMNASRDKLPVLLHPHSRSHIADRGHLET